MSSLKKIKINQPKQLDLFGGKVQTNSPPIDERKKQILAESPFAALPPLPKRRINRADKIYLPSKPVSIQNDISTTLNYQMYPPGTFPFIGGRSVVLEILNSAQKGQWIGLDFEYDVERRLAEIVGVSFKNQCAGSYWDAGVAAALKNAVDRGVIFVAHNGFSADKPVLEKTLKIDTPWDQYIDSMILHYLCHAALCKTAGKGEEEGSIGFNGLGFASHLWTQLPSYKSCRGVGCFGPCPRHKPLEYCAIDAWAGEQIAVQAKELMHQRQMPWRVYEEHAYLAFNFCLKSEWDGIDVDLYVVKNLEKILEEEKAKLFPSTNGVYERFNPRSGKQVTEWFGERNIKIRDTQKDTVHQLLEKQLFDNYGYTDLDSFQKDEEASPLSEADQALYDLYVYKDLGKGGKSWFDAKFFGPDGKLHPRCIYTGASTLRFSYSRPNFQNVAKRSWGKKIRKAIVPPPGMQLVETDCRQLELRMCLFLAGFDLTKLRDDPFSWLVEQAAGAFDKTAADTHKTPRDVAKMVSHSSNYGAGLDLLDPYELQYEHIQRQIKNGSLLVYQDWIYDDRIVCLNGRRLAYEFFRDWTEPSRAAALGIQQTYFGSVPIQQWHRRLLNGKPENHVLTQWGSYLELLEKSTMDNARVKIAKLGQGGGAEYVQGMQLFFLKNCMKPDTKMMMQIHDALVFAVPKEWSVDKIKQFLAPLSETESHRYPGLKVPWSVEYGPNWGEMKKVE